MIIKLPLDLHHTIVPLPGQFLHFGYDPKIERLCLWVDSDPGHPFQAVILAATGDNAPTGRHLGTAMLPDGALVLHLYDVTAEGPLDLDALAWEGEAHR